MKIETNHEAPGKPAYNTLSAVFARQNSDPRLEGNFPEREEVALLNYAG